MKQPVAVNPDNMETQIMDIDTVEVPAALPNEDQN